MHQNLKILIFSSIFLFSFLMAFYFLKNLPTQSFLGQISELANRERISESDISNLKEKFETLKNEVEGLKNLKIVAGEAKTKIEKTEKEEVKACQNFESKPKLEVIFNEICWMGDEDSPANEWIELKNISQREIDLAGWQILNKNQKIKIVFDERKIKPGEILVLERGDDFLGAIKNSKELLFLFDKDCNLQDKVEATSTWPAGDKKTKRTAERKEDFSWQTSENPGGTPGKENSRGFEEIKKEEIEEKLEPKISLDFPSQIFSQKEFEVSLSVSDLKDDTYDVKISVLKISDESEQKRTISEISLTGEEWQDSYKYLTKVFTGNSFSGKFKLRITQDFSGQAEIVAKIRQNINKKVVAEFSKKILVEKIQKIVQTSEETQLPSTESSQEFSFIKVLINEIQIAGQTPDDEFIELYNPTDQAIDLSNWKLTRKTSSGAEYTILSNKTTVKFSGIIQPHSFFLIAHPNSSFISIADIVHHGTQSLAANNTLILYDPSGTIIDKVGWGNAVDFEGSPFPQNPEPNQSLERINFGDSNDNSRDFQINFTPTPKK